ncbi:unnamed protein product [Clonostachys rosea]|uniref:ACT domain-containing protein n=1 Tax=Bionectria ochroleuca TaxID=29856 RepID=A0ABY6UZ38_BIOOC|nr:unnamed protein product [Clonostachys rosea]
MAPPTNDHILTLSCPDRPGIVHAVTGLFASQGHNIADLQQFSDTTSNRFFMRVHFAQSPSAPAADSVDHLQPLFAALAAEYAMDFRIQPFSQKTRVLLMVSKIGHCLNDLLYRMKAGQLAIEVPLIVSNHPDFEPLAASYGIPFFHLPVNAATKPQQETRILELVREHNVELVVLARYMQILSPILCDALPGRIINIHHSFLPSFKGAKPYHQAYDRGVKIIGATAHFATVDLDEGPIIEQQVSRVNHGMDPKDLTVAGSNTECLTLATAVKWYSERRVFLNGIKTVVFS